MVWFVYDALVFTAAIFAGIIVFRVRLATCSSARGQSSVLFSTGYPHDGAQPVYPLTV